MRQNYLLAHFRDVSPGSAVIKLLRNSASNYRSSCYFTGSKLGFSLEKKMERNVIISKQDGNMNNKT